MLGMSNLRPLTQAELEDMVTNLSDEEYCNSDYGGDDDAEDELPLKTLSTSRPSSSRSSSLGSAVGLRKRAVSSTASQNVIDSEDEDYHDSDNDRDFDLKDDLQCPPNKIAKLFSKDYELSCEDEPEDEIVSSEIVSPMEITWSWSKKSDQVLTFNNYNFSESPGINVDIDSLKPVDFFRVYFDKNICELIVVESNLYAIQQKTQLDLYQEELDAFLGVLIIMGFHCLPALRSYWSTNMNIHVERVAKVFTLKRFLKILRYLHLNDNQKMPQPKTANFDKLYKIRPLLTHLSEAFSAAFTSHRNLSIDESMCPFKGGTSLKQYMPMKPIKRGFKIWALACSKTAYLVTFQVYQGKVESSSSEYMLGERVVLNLSKKFQNRGYCLYFDNFFTTIPLMQKLLNRGLFGCGTIRQNRKHFPKNVICTDKELRQNQSDSVAAGEVSVCKWKDRGVKCVAVTSNMYDFQEKTEVLRTNKTGDRDKVSCPKSIAGYNMQMGGVDLFDQLHANYSVSWQSRRWWMKLFYYLFDATIVNSYILYKQTLKKKKP